MAVFSRVNPTFPIPGIDQSSKGFRDNFQTIKTEIENLQGKQLVFTGALAGTTASIIDSGPGPIVVHGVVSQATGNGFFVGATPPSSPNPGDRWVNLNDGDLYTWFVDGSEASWINFAGGAAATSANLTISLTAPASPVTGDRWVNLNDGILYTWYNDGALSSWINFSNSGALPNISNPISTYVLRGTSTNAAIKLAATSVIKVKPDPRSLQNSTVQSISATVMGRDTITGNVGTWDIKAVVKQGMSSGSTAFVGSPSVTTVALDSAWSGISDPALIINATSGGIDVEVYPITSNACNWIAKITVIELL